MADSPDKQKSRFSIPEQNYGVRCGIFSLKRRSELLKNIGNYRDGIIVLAGIFYFFGYIAWALHAHDVVIEIPCLHGLQVTAQIRHRGLGQEEYLWKWILC